jgi:PD-(D/E)XK endonuclease
MKICIICKEPFKPIQPHQKYCGWRCRQNHRNDVEIRFSSSMPKKSVGAKSELLVCCDLLSKGYEVFRNVSAHGSCDLIAVKKETILRIEVKTGHIRTSGNIGYSKPYSNKFEVLAVVIPGKKVVYKPEL